MRLVYAAQGTEKLLTEPVWSYFQFVEAECPPFATDLVTRMAAEYFTKRNRDVERMTEPTLGQPTGEGGNVIGIAPIYHSSDLV